MRTFAVGAVLREPCPECGSAMILRKSRYGLFYGCSAFPNCRSTHGAHPDGAPLGHPADKATRTARVAAHAAFDAMWKNGGMLRKDAYRWMQGVMRLRKHEAHIAKFDRRQCEELIRHCGERMVLPRRYDAWEALGYEVFR
jgi:ssDNA-binding Zn-finger/Zn-ribbon topoisomerase 1